MLIFGYEINVVIRIDNIGGYRINIISLNVIFVLSTKVLTIFLLTKILLYFMVLLSIIIQV